MGKDDILNLKIEHSLFEPNYTIRDYLCELLIEVWEERETFSGKRPFGNSDWEYDLYKPLVKNGIVEGKMDDDHISNVNEKQANNLIRSLIVYCFYGN
jgi:hypothetical protein